MNVQPRHFCQQNQNHDDFELHFGGPDYPCGNLRNVLEQRILETPASGSIDWVTYYFRDLKLARALVDASHRGVKVTVTLSKYPRCAAANQEVIKLLSGTNGIGHGLNAVSMPGIPAPRGRAWRLQLHEKLYCFSHPRPVAFLGSFNPSGNEPEQYPHIIEEIGDHNQGYNALLGIKDPDIVQALSDHARFLHRCSPDILYRFSAQANAVVNGTNTRVYFWPRVQRHPVICFLDSLPSNSHIRIAASHIRSLAAVRHFIALSKKGAVVEILTESSLRRVPRKIESNLKSAGVQIRRIRHPKGLPMHLKFALVSTGHESWSIFGSFNWTNPSFYLNHEIAAISADGGVYEALSNQWKLLQEQSYLYSIPAG